MNEEILCITNKGEVAKNEGKMMFEFTKCM